LDSKNTNLMISLSNAKIIKIDNVIINGNIGIFDTEVVSLASSDIMGDIILSNIKKEFLIQNIHFKQNNEIINNGYIITLKESSKGTISNITVDADVNAKQIISIYDCSNLIIKDSNFNGSLNKMKDISNFHTEYLYYLTIVTLTK